MGKKCCVENCRSGYYKKMVAGQRQYQQEDLYHGKKVRFYSFPNNQRERQMWLDSLPNRLSKVTKFMGVCSKHWPPDVAMRKNHGQVVPAVPPTIFPSLQALLNSSWEEADNLYLTLNLHEAEESSNDAKPSVWTGVESGLGGA